MTRLWRRFFAWLDAPATPHDPNAVMRTCAFCHRTAPEAQMRHKIFGYYMHGCTEGWVCGSECRHALKEDA